MLMRFVTVYQVSTSQYLTETLDFSEVDRKKIRAIIAGNYLLDSSKFSASSIAPKILKLYPNFTCSIIKEFLENKPTGVFEGNDPEDITEVIQIFNHAVIFEASSKVDFDNCLKFRYDKWHKGISILPGKKECRVCKGNPGCICLYVPFTKP